MSGTSPKQLEANKRNAQRSTGPRTPAGKARIKFNALRHGLLAKSVILPIRSRSEKRSHFDALLEQLIDELKPVGILEDMLVEKIAVSYWRLRRALRAEAGEICDNIRNFGSGSVWDIYGLKSRFCNTDVVNNEQLLTQIKILTIL